jgi:hypothetical protein
MEEELFVEEGGAALCSGAEELIGDVHEDAEIASGVVGEAGFEGIGDECGVAGGVEEVVEAFAQVIAFGVAEEEAAANARGEGEEVGMAQAVGEAVVTGEDDAQEGMGVEGFGGEETDFAQDAGVHFLGFIDDEDGACGGGGEMGGPALAEGFEADPAVVVGQGDVEELAELTVKVGESALGMVDGADADVAAAVEPVGEKAEGDAFAGAGLAGDEGKAAVVHGELDAAAKGVDGGGEAQSIEGDIRAKGVEFEAKEAEEVTIHRLHSCGWWWPAGPAR